PEPAQHRPVKLDITVRAVSSRRRDLAEIAILSAHAAFEASAGSAARGSCRLLCRRRDRACQSREYVQGERRPKRLSLGRAERPVELAWGGTADPHRRAQPHAALCRVSGYLLES